MKEKTTSAFKMVYNRNILSYNETMAWARKNKIKSSSHWKKLAKEGKIPIGIPKSPQFVYKEWKGWENFHGNKIARGHHLPYNQAKKVLKKLGVKSSWKFKKLKQAHKLPDNIPKQPERTYKNLGWKGAGDFFGTKRNGNWQNKSNFRSYKEAKSWARSSTINSAEEYKHAKLPKGIPRNPWNFYKNEWEGMKIFLDVKPKYISCDEAKIIVRKLKIRSGKEYKEIPKNIKRKYKLPSKPEYVYKKMEY